MDSTKRNILIASTGIIITAGIIIAGISLPEQSFASKAILPAIRLLLTLFAAGYTANKLLPLISRQKTLNLPFTECCLLFVPSILFLLIIITAAAGFSGFLQANTIIILTVLLAVITGLRYPGNRINVILPHPDCKILLLLLPAGIVLTAGLAIFLPFTPGQWDSLTYHLYIPARWVQERMIFHVPTVFGDEAAAFAPANAMVFYSCLLALLNSDTLMNCIAPVFLLLAALTLYKITLTLKGSQVSAAIVATIVIITPAIVIPAFSAYTDIMAQALLLTGVWWMLKYIREKRFEYSFYCSMCCGLALGTKTIMLPFTIPVLLIPGIFMLARKDWRSMLTVIALTFAAGGWWYCRTLALYGNPLFPAEVKLFGIVLFKGVFSMEALSSGNHHIGQMQQLWLGAYQYFNITGFILMSAGLAGWIMIFWKDKQRRLQAGVILTLILIWTLTYCYVIPFNNQYRFMLGIWLLSLPGVALLFDFIRQPRLKLSAASIIFILLLLSTFKDLWFISHGLPVLIIAGFAVAVIACGNLLLLSFYHKSRALLTLGIVMIFATLIAAETCSWKLRIFTLAKSNAGAFEQAFTPFNQESLQMQPMTIAYAGLNIPYIFVGPHLKNRVIYCNIAGNYRDGCYEFWKRYGKMHYAFDGPKLYQWNNSCRLWLKNLRQAKAQALAVMLLHPFERKLHFSTPDGFPPEAAWAAANPELFIPVVKTPVSRVYLINQEALKNLKL
ncbi:MAG: hypothetical protein WC071_05765 [Victivallaceae bacterium]